MAAPSVRKGRRKVLAELADRRIVVDPEADRIAAAGHIAVVASAVAAFADLSRGGRDPLLRDYEVSFVVRMIR